MDNDIINIKKRSIEHPILDMNIQRKKKWKKKDDIIEERKCKLFIK